MVGIKSPGSMASRVIYLREEKNMKPADLARASGLSQPSVWAIESGQTQPEKIRASTLLRLAAALDSTPDYIRDGIGNPHPGKEPADARELMNIFASMSEPERAAILAAAKALKR